MAVLAVGKSQRLGGVPLQRFKVFQLLINWAKLFFLQTIALSCGFGKGKFAPIRSDKTCPNRGRMANKAQEKTLL